MATTFWDLLDDIDGLCSAFSAIERSLTEKQRDHLRELFLSLEGEPSERHGNNVVKSRTRVSCSRIGALLTTNFGGVGAKDHMSWVGVLTKQADGRERWVMRPEIREALIRLNWFGPRPVQFDPTPEPSIVVADRQTDLEDRAARFALVEVRTEQVAFRKAVFKACNGRCVISGNSVPEVLEAAHLKGRSWRGGHNSAQDGLLLRRDLHALYDNSLLTIEEDWRVGFDESIASHYPEFFGKIASLPTSTALR